MDRKRMDHFSYYCTQAGHGHQYGGSAPFAVFRGTQYQRGYGVFSNVFKRYGVPLLRYLGPKILAKGREIASDIYLRDVPAKAAFKSRLKQGGKEILRDSLNRAATYANQSFDQEGAGSPLNELQFTPYGRLALSRLAEMHKRQKRGATSVRSRRKRRRTQKGSGTKRAKKRRKLSVRSKKRTSAIFQ